MFYKLEKNPNGINIYNITNFFNNFYYVRKRKATSINVR